MSDEQEPLIHWDARIITIGELGVAENEDAEHLVTGYRIARIVTVNGQIWEKAFLPFGLTIQTVSADWNQRQLNTWTRRIV